MQTRVEFHGTVDRGAELQQRFAPPPPPAAGAKTNDIIAKPCAVHLVSAYVLCPSAMLFLIFCFRRFGVFFELVFHADLCARKEGMKS